MSITSELARVQATLQGSGETISVGFYFLATTDLTVIKTVAGVDSTLVLGTHYTVSGAGNELGGSITMIGGANGDVITIYRAVAFNQDTELTYAGQQPAATLERGYDRLVMQVQKLGEQVKRALRIPVSNAEVAEMSLNARKGKTLQFNASTGALELTDSADSAAAAAQASAAAAVDAAESAAAFASALTVDLLSFGFNPSATAAVNTAAINAALAGGNKRLKCDGVGTYSVNDCIIFDDNTILDLSLIHI